MSRRTEEAYVRWITAYLRYHRDKSGDWRHPAQMGDLEINDFLTYLAVEKNVAASTQNQALSGLLFLYREVLQLPITFNAVRAKRPLRVPVVLSIDEVRRVLREIPPGPHHRLAGLMYGAGLRLLEACRRSCITVRDGKGNRDRMVPLPEKLVPSRR